MNKQLETLQFRRAGSPDAQAVSTLISLFCQDFFTHPDGAGAEVFLNSVSEQAERSYIEDARYSYILACMDERLAGFIALRDTSHIFHLFVSPDFQGKGLAKKLWQRTQELSARHGYEGPFTVNSSVKAIPVYERLGFTPSSDLIQSHGISFLPMRLDLKPPSPSA